MRAKTPSPLPVTYIELSAAFPQEHYTEATVGNGGFRDPGYSVWRAAQRTIDEWRERISMGETIGLIAMVEWADGWSFEYEMNMQHPSVPCLSEECKLVVHLRRYLEYDAGLREYWAPSRAAMRRVFVRGVFGPGVTVEEVERDLDMRDAERQAKAAETLATREVPKVPASHRDPHAELAVLLYRLAGRDVQPSEMDAYAWEDALGRVDCLPDAVLRPPSPKQCDRLLSLLLQHEEHQVRLAGVRLSARLANLSSAPKPRKKSTGRAG